MSAPLRRTLVVGVRASLRSRAIAAGYTARDSRIAHPAAPTREAASGGIRGFASESDDDFKPKVHASGGAAVQEAIAASIKEHRVVLYMKGTPAMPRCGFSNIAVQILNNQGVEYKTHDVLGSEELRQGIKEFSSWPTIPQLFIDGEFIGGCDIMKQMHTTGELNKVLGTETGWKAAK